MYLPKLIVDKRTLFAVDDVIADTEIDPNSVPSLETETVAFTLSPEISPVDPDSEFTRMLTSL